MKNLLEVTEMLESVDSEKKFKDFCLFYDCKGPTANKLSFSNSQIKKIEEIIRSVGDNYDNWFWLWKRMYVPCPARDEVWNILKAKAGSFSQRMYIWQDSEYHDQSKRSEAFSFLMEKAERYIDFGWAWNYTRSEEEKAALWEASKKKFSATKDMAAIIWAISYDKESPQAKEAVRILLDSFESSEISKWVEKNLESWDKEFFEKFFSKIKGVK